MEYRNIALIVVLVPTDHKVYNFDKPDKSINQKVRIKSSTFY